MRNRLGNLVGRLRQGARAVGERLRNAASRIFRRRAASTSGGRSSGT